MSDDDARRRLVHAVLDAASAARMRIAILGGTGSFGRALAVRLAAAGEDEIVIGSRDESAGEDDRRGARLGRPGRDERRTPSPAPTSPCSR